MSLWPILKHVIITSKIKKTYLRITNIQIIDKKNCCFGWSTSTRCNFDFQHTPACHVSLADLVDTKDVLVVVVVASFARFASTPAHKVTQTHTRTHSPSAAVCTGRIYATWRAVFVTTIYILYHVWNSFCAHFTRVGAVVWVEGRWLRRSLGVCVWDIRLFAHRTWFWSRKTRPASAHPNAISSGRAGTHANTRNGYYSFTRSALLSTFTRTHTHALILISV